MSNRLRLIALIAIEYLKRNWKKAALALGVFLFALFLVLRFNLIDSEASLSEGFIGTYQSHDLPLEVTRLVSSGLVDVDKSGHAVPKLAQSWQTNNDATIFTFKLKPNLRWSDNNVLKSSDLEFAIPDVEVSFPDDQDIQFKLKESYSPFPTLLTKPLFKKGTLLGVGPYKIAKIEKSRIFITKISLIPLDSNMPKVNVRFYPNEKTALTGFGLGEVQSLLGASNSSSLMGTRQLQLTQKTDYGKIITILYNTKDPILSNKSIRQALSYISPKIENEVSANNPFSSFSWAYGSENKKYLANAEMANQALEKAKSSSNSDLLNKELILTSTPNLKAVGEKVVEAWRSLGFQAKLRVESGIPQNFSALLIAQSIPVDPDQYFLWHSTQDKTNLTKYSSTCCPMSARVDKDLEDGRKIIGEDDRKAKYLDFQKTLLEDAPAAFLYYPKYNILYLSKAKTNLDKVLPLQFSAQYN